MLRALRRKFIALNMATVAAVVLAVLVTIGVASYQQEMGRAYASLEASVEVAMRDDLTAAPGGGLGGRDPFAMPELGGHDDRSMPAAVYASCEDGTFEPVTRATSATLAESDLVAAIAATSGVSEGQGVLSDPGLLYVKRVSPDGRSYLAFADEANASSWKLLALRLVGVGVGALTAFFVISLFFSRWALRPVERAWTQQRQFVADASHELKTPITVILANMSIMLRHPEATISSQSQWVESTQREAQGMQALVGDLLDLARLEQDAVPMSTSPVDLSTLVEGGVLQFESVAFERDVPTEYEVEPGIEVLGDAARLERVVTILLDNACKYAAVGTPVRVTLARSTSGFRSVAGAVVRGSVPNGACAVMTVTNQGEGISAASLPHVFDRFYRSDEARVRADGSYGLGLAIAAETVEAHGGAISVVSEADAGTTFTVALPLA